MSSDPAVPAKTPMTCRPLSRSMWRLCKLGYTHEPRLVVVVVALTLLQAVPGCAVRAVAEAARRRRSPITTTRLVFAVLGAMAASATLSWLLRVIDDRLTRRFRDRVTIALETHVATLQASVAGLELQERRTTSTGSPCCATRCSCWTTCTCRCSAPSAGSSGSCSPWRCWPRSIPLLMLLVVFAIPTVISSAWRPAVERQVEETLRRSTAGSPSTCSRPRPAPRPARRSGSPASGRTWRRGGGPNGSAGSPRSPRARWTTALSHAVAWAIFGLGYVGAVVFVAVGLQAGGRIGAADPRGRGPARPPTSAAPWARSDSSAASGWTAPGGWSGWRTTSRRSTPDADVDVPDRLADGIRLEGVTFAYPGAGPARAGRRHPHPAARRGGRGRRGERGREVDPGQAAGQDVRADGRVGSWSTADRWRGCRRPTGGNGSPGRSRTSSGSSSAPSAASGSATCRDLDDAEPAGGAVVRAGATDVIAATAGRPGQPARPDLAGRSGAELRPVAEARPVPRLHARRAAADGAGRADRRAGRRDRARAVRAVRRRRPRQSTSAASPCWCRTGSARCGWPT